MAGTKARSAAVFRRLLPGQDARSARCATARIRAQSLNSMCLSKTITPLSFFTMFVAVEAVAVGVEIVFALGPCSP